MVGRRPWESFYPPGCSAAAAVETSTLPELLDGAVDRWGERPFIEYRGFTQSFAAFRACVDQLASGLIAAGVKPRQRIALYLPNTLWHPIAFFAALRAGACVVHLSPLDAKKELIHKIRDSGANVLISTDQQPMADLAASLQEAGVIARLFFAEEARWNTVESARRASAEIASLATLMSGELLTRWPHVAETDTAVLQYTGGTTGVPKGAMLTHANLTAAVSMYRLWRQPGWPGAGQGRCVGVLPLFHIYALTAVLLYGLHDGNLIFLHPRFDAQAVLQDIVEKHANMMPAVPTMWIALADHPAAQNADFSSLIVCAAGGAPMPMDVRKRVEGLIGRQLLGGWGMTETSPAGTRIPASVPPRPGLIGVPLPGIDMRVVALDDPHRVLMPDEAGEIAIKGPNVFAGYWNRPGETAQAFADGYFLTGDIGVMAPDGTFALFDRKQSMIISGGFNVYPAVIENAIAEHPSVAEVIVIGIPDAYRGQAAKAFVRLREGCSAFSLESLRDFLADSLGRHELPVALEFREMLPRSSVGKPLRVALELEEAAAMLGLPHDAGK